MEHTTRIELENLKDLHLAEVGIINIRRCAATHHRKCALVDTGATGLCLPKSLIEQLGLTPLRSIGGQTANGPRRAALFIQRCRYTVLERT